MRRLRRLRRLRRRPERRRPERRRTRGRGGEARSAGLGVLSLEFALLVLATLGALMLLAAAWRLGQTRGEVRDAAAEATRAASLRQSPVAAAAAAREVAEQVLAGRDRTCSDLTVVPDVTDLRPGGSVSVTIRCVTRLEDLTLLSMPGAVAVEVTATEVVDRRRGG